LSPGMGFAKAKLCLRRASLARGASDF
jgi:hypothetical protein